ncbi:hypothetical protein BCL93_110135 [Onishia taeanensis]|uniref:O-antigen ligase n=1 Tax=Onishia taeanensis TaxID=284577 RepID=A0A328XLK2_9GAMM|nr:hypothetical protein [Halomonas taeanensis]RAR59102.1 hypothetical protein BCL93_110135 [Halomonas taeanensis]
MIWLIWFTLVFASVLSPLYVYPSGSAQPTDYVFLALVCLVYVHALATSRELPLAKIPIYWGLLAFWVFVHCLVSSLVLQSSDFYRTMAFWVYNTAVASCFLYLLGMGPKSKIYIEWGICLGLITSGVGVILSLGVEGRAVGFFNNPNQLAFFSLLGISSLLVLARMRLLVKPLIILAVLSGILGIFAAASLAAIAGFFLVVVGYLLANLQPKQLFRFSVILSLLFMTSLLVDDKAVTRISENIYSRSVVAEGKFDSIGEERNYDRILAFPEYTLVGAGEGHLDRFYPYDKNEIHSSLGNLLFAYGVPGIALFMALLYSVLRSSPPPIWFVVSGPIVYSLTHMGLRTTLFWIFLAIVWSEYGAKKSYA